MKEPLPKLLAIRQMVCLLADQADGNILDGVRQSLRVLCETVPLAAAGLIWEPIGRPCREVCWPESSPRMPPPLSTTDMLPGAELLERDGDAPWLITPLGPNGAAGRLWAVPHPGYVLDDRTRETLSLVAGQLALACRNADLREDLMTQSARQDILLHRLVHVSEECRRHVARELHDEISQSLAALILQADTAQATLRSDVGMAALSLEKLRGGLAQLMDEVQRLVLQLRPALLEQRGLLEALRWYGQQYLQPAGAQFHAAGGRCAPNLPMLTRLTLYRIGQEAIANAARHSHARNVWLEITCRGDLLILTVRDDGCGFDPAETLAHPQDMKGLGLLSMQERAALLGGTLTIDSAPGRGACVQFSAPLAEGCRP